MLSRRHFNSFLLDKYSQVCSHQCFEEKNAASYSKSLYDSYIKYLLDYLYEPLIQ